MKIGFFQSKFTLVLCILFFTQVSFSLEIGNITNINFLQEGEVSKIVIDVDQATFAERKHLIDDKQIILDLKNVKANKKVLRGFDTSEFSGSIVYVSGYNKPDQLNDIRFAIQLRDNVRSILDVKNRQIVLSVENRFGVFFQERIAKAEGLANQNIDPEDIENSKVNVPKSSSIDDILENLTLSGVKKYVGKRISINVKDMPLVEVLQMIAETSGFNIIIDDEVKGRPNLTLSLNNIPWDQALDTIMSLNNLIAQKHSNILTVKTLEKIRKERELEIASKAALATNEPLVTKIFPISFAKIQSMRGILGEYSSSRGKISTDDRTNSLIVKDTLEVIERMKKIIEVLDTQTPQVLIQGKIVEVEEGSRIQLGLTNGIQFEYKPFGLDATDEATSTDPSGVVTFSSATTEDAPTFASLTIDVFKNIRNLSMSLALLESESKAKTISSPKVITENNKVANISSSEVRQFPTTQPGVNGSPPLTTLQPLTASVNLSVTPQVTNEGSIAMNVSLSKSSFGASVSLAVPPPTFNRNITTNVLVDNGSTVVIGGVYQTNTDELNAGIPFLKDLPLVGWLFRTPYQKRESTTELVIFLTPRIINQEEAGLSNKTGTEI